MTSKDTTIEQAHAALVDRLGATLDLDAGLAQILHPDAPLDEARTDAKSAIGGAA